jgi:hypothetical protein
MDVEAALTLGPVTAGGFHGIAFWVIFEARQVNNCHDGR